VPEEDFLPRLGAGCLVLIGVVIAVVGIASVKGSIENLGSILYCRLFGGGFAFAGGYWYRYVRAQERTRRRLFEEKQVLAVALNHGGYATLAQLVLEAPFTAAEAEAAMQRICRQGLAHPDLLDDGTVRYRFGGLLGE
jgi:hypothetical protein